MDFIQGLVMDGLLPVFTALLSFLPQVVILLTIVSLFENSGFTLSFGCTTLAVSAIEKNGDEKYQKRMLRFLTFIPCSAQLPVLTFICATILGWSVFGVAFLYIFAIFVGLCFGGFAVLRIPKLKRVSLLDLLKNIVKNMFEYFKRISIGVVLAATVLYTLQYFSILVPMARIFEPIFVPIGLGSAAAIACLAFGLVGKELIIGAILTFGVANLGLTTAGVISFLLFTLLYTPCLPALTAIKAKFGWKTTISTALFNFAVAYVVSLVVYNAIVMLQ